MLGLTFDSSISDRNSDLDICVYNMWYLVYQASLGRIDISTMKNISKTSCNRII